MKQIKLKQKYIQAISEGNLSTLLIIDDNHDITVDDEVEVIDDEAQEVIGSLIVDEVNIKRMRDFANNKDALVEINYEQVVNPDVLAKKITFSYKAYTKKLKLEETVVPLATDITEVKLYGDGGSRGNPGPAASGWVVFDLNGTILKEGGYYLGITTNNQAEYTALKLGLGDALQMGAKKVQVFMDSLLVVNQLKGIFKVRNKDLMPIYLSIVELAKQFDRVTYTHVPREFNKEADRMVNETLDSVASNQ